MSNQSNTSKFKVECTQTKIPDLKALDKSVKPGQYDDEFEYSPYKITELQCYNPILSDFINTGDAADTVTLNHPYHIIDLNTVSKNSETIERRPVHVKFSPLLDPLRYMIGKYDLTNNKTIALPKPTGDETTNITKILSKNNASYVDNFFCFLSSKVLESHGFLHGLEYYGSFVGIQDKYKMNIIDDFDYLQSSDFFKENIGKYFKVTDNDADSYVGGGSRGNKPKITIPSGKHNTTDISVIDLGDSIEEVIDLGVTEIEEVYEKQSNHSSSTSSYDSSNNSETNYSSDEENDSENGEKEEDDEEAWETESESNSVSSGDEEEAVYSYIDNYPIQMICLEKCHGTLDELFMKNKINDKNGASILFQIIMILLTYQEKFHFTHNDLHTNNIMFTNTDIKFLYYKYGGKTYKVPTHGRIFKLIDFGRSIYKFQNNLYCSDSFFTGGDAATQYNFEPFMNNKKPRLDPNYSFDLCRLGTSIYDFIIEDDHKPSQLDELQKTILRWCKDDNDKNILYKRDGSERYPGFRLYKMISRTVHQHTPEEQLKQPYFSQFQVDSVEEGAVLMDIDAIPVYSTN